MSNKSNLTEEYKQDIATILLNVSDGLSEKVEKNLAITIDKLTEEVKRRDSIDKLVKEIDHLKLDNNLFHKEIQNIDQNLIIRIENLTDELRQIQLDNKSYNLDIFNLIKNNDINEKYNKLNNEILNLNYKEQIESLEEKVSFQKYLLYIITSLLILIFIYLLIKSDI